MVFVEPKMRVLGLIGLMSILLFGYFATLQGIAVAIRGYPVVLALAGVVLIAIVVASLREAKPRKSIASPEDNQRSARFQNIANTLFSISALVFAVEVSLPSQNTRIWLGLLALVLFLLAFAALIASSGISNRR